MLHLVLWKLLVPFDHGVGLFLEEVPPHEARDTPTSLSTGPSPQTKRPAQKIEAQGLLKSNVMQYLSLIVKPCWFLKP